MKGREGRKKINRQRKKEETMTHKIQNNQLKEIHLNVY
jgi:hypothetical protein